MDYAATFAFIERLDRSSNIDEVMDAMQTALSPYGFEFLSIFSFPRPGQRFEEVRVGSRVPAEWSKVYLEKQYVHVSPAVRHCRRTVYPFVWTTAPYDPEREPRVAELVAVMTDFGLLNSISVPVPGPGGCEGCAWLGGPRLKLTARENPMVHLIALYAFERLRTLVRKLPAAKPSLTSREREVVTWVAMGKYAWEIGEILGIAKRTVDEHMQTTMQKLGAVNRTQAVAVAPRERLIEP